MGNRDCNILLKPWLHGGQRFKLRHVLDGCQLHFWRRLIHPTLHVHDVNKTRRCGSVYLGVVVLSVREVCYVYEGYVASAVVLYI